MGGKSGKTQTVTQVQTNDPWAPAQPYLKQSLDMGAQAVRTPMQYFPGSTVAGFSGATMRGLGGIAQRAGQTPAMFGEAQGAVGRAMGPSGFGANPFGQQMIGAAQQGTDVSALRGFTSGQPNPYLGDLWGQGSRQITDQVNAQFTGSGRTGGAQHVDTLTRGLGDFTSQLYGQAYEADRNRALSAANSLAGFSSGDLDRLTGAYGQAGSFYSDDRAADQRQQGIGLTATSMLPGLRDYGASGDMDFLKIGQMLDEQRQARLDDEVARWNFQQQQPRNDAMFLSGLATGVGGLGGTSNSTSTQPRQRSNPFLGGLGGAAAGAQVGSMFGPYGAMIGGGVGLLGGLFG